MSRLPVANDNIDRSLTRSSWWLVAASAFAVLAAKLTGVI